MSDNEQLSRIVLSVDDDEDAHVILKLAFAKAGIATPLITLSGGGEAISYLTGEGKFADRAVYPLPAVLLLDLKMPGVSGFDVLQHIGSTPALKALPVIAFSSSAASADIDKAYKLGCHAYVTKPAGFTSLIRLVVALAAQFLGRPELQWKGETPQFSEFTAFPSDRRTAKFP